MKNILEEAMEDSKLLKETAIENAKNVLIEAISPKIKKLVEQQLGETEVALEMADGAEKSEEDGKEMKEMASAMDESGMYEMEDEMPVGHDDMAEAFDDDGHSDMKAHPGFSDDGHEDMKSEGKDEDEKGDDEDETVEMTKEDFNAALSEVLKSMKHIDEVTVSKGFGDSGKVSVTDGNRGLMDTKSGEHFWNDEEAPDAQDWSMKEAKYVKQIKKLVKERNEAVTAFRKLHGQLKEVNLFNSKLVYTNKLLQKSHLNERQRSNVIETFDRAQSIREVELVYRSLSESLKIAGALVESKRTVQGKSSRTVQRSNSMLNEGAQRGEEKQSDDFSRRMKELSGIID